MGKIWVLLFLCYFWSTHSDSSNRRDEEEEIHDGKRQS